LEESLDILGVKNPADARRAYIQLARKYHPDNNFGNEDKSTEEFKIVNDAFGVIKKSLEPPTQKVPIGRKDSIDLDRKDSIQRTASWAEPVPPPLPSKIDVAFDNLKVGVSNGAAMLTGVAIAGTLGNIVAPDTFPQITLDVIGNQLIKTAINSVVFPNICGDSIACNIVGVIGTNVFMDSHFSNNKKIEAINQAKITFKKQIETFKDVQDTANNKIPLDVKANMEFLRDTVYDGMKGSNFMAKKIGKTELVISKNGAKVCEILVNSNYVVSIFDINSDYVIHVFRTASGTEEQIRKTGSENIFPSSVIKSGSPLSEVIKQIHLTVEKNLGV